jgi:adenosylcobinamide-phosphate synthase
VGPDGGRADAEPADDPAAGWPRPDGGRAEASPNGASTTGGPRSALRAWWRDGAAHPSPNAGRVEAAFAGALGVRLGGRNVYGGRVEERPVLHGEGRAPGPADLRRAADLSRRVGALAAVAAAGAAVLLRRR